MLVGISVSICIVSSSFNIVMKKVKERKSIEKIKSDVLQKGYDINPKFIRNMFKYTKKGNDKMLFQTDFENWSCIVPGLNLIGNIFNVQYLYGDYRNNLIYDFYETFGEDIDFLLDNELIVKNKDAEWYEDRDNALKELEKKYDEIPSSPKPESVVVVSEEDSMDELYEKFERLQEIILRKQSSNNEIKTDNNTLKYGNKEGNKDERVKQ